MTLTPAEFVQWKEGEADLYRLNAIELEEAQVRTMQELQRLYATMPLPF